MNAKKAKTPAIDIGIGAGERKKIAQGLSALLADSYTLYLMTHNFHWNVTGPDFNSLHLMFMAQYTEQRFRHQLAFVGADALGLEEVAQHGICGVFHLQCGAHGLYGEVEPVFCE